MTPRDLRNQEVRRIVRETIDDINRRMGVAFSVGHPCIEEYEIGKRCWNAGVTAERERCQWIADWVGAHDTFSPFRWNDEFSECINLLAHAGAVAGDIKTVIEEGQSTDEIENPSRPAAPPQDVAVKGRIAGQPDDIAFGPAIENQTGVDKQIRAWKNCPTCGGRGEQAIYGGTVQIAQLIPCLTCRDHYAELSRAFGEGVLAMLAKCDDPSTTITRLPPIENPYKIDNGGRNANVTNR